MSRYFESAPARSFQPYVVCNWKHIFEGDCAHDFKVLPDGCVDIILIGDRPPLVVGPNLKAFVASFDGPTKIVGIRLKPGIAAAVLNENVKNIVDREVPLEDLWGSRAPKLQDAVSHDEKRRLLESIILWKLRTVDGRVMDAVRHLSADPNLRVPRNLPLAIVSRRGISCACLKPMSATDQKPWPVSFVCSEHFP
jgi:hypothetical protein